MRIAIALIIGLLVLSGCSHAELGRAESATYEASKTKRCVAFHRARSEAHQRIGDIAEQDLRRLHEINVSGRVICREALEQLTLEITEIVEGLP